MTNEKKSILQRLTARVSTGLSFIEFNYLNHHPTPDSAWIRNIYILLSFYTELQFKAIYIALNEFVDTNDLEKKLKEQGHDLEKLGKTITEAALAEFGIRAVKKVNHEYIVETEYGDFHVMDFIDIRYDFLDGRIRTLDGTEHEMFERQIECMLQINKKLKPLAWD